MVHKGLLGLLVISVLICMVRAPLDATTLPTGVVRYPGRDAHRGGEA
jgi:hypothetical protein